MAFPHLFSGSAINASIFVVYVVLIERSSKVILEFLYAMPGGKLLINTRQFSLVYLFEIAISFREIRAGIWLKLYLPEERTFD
jgi:hypothetical protein